MILYNETSGQIYKKLVIKINYIEWCYKKILTFTSHNTVKGSILLLTRSNNLIKQ